MFSTNLEKKTESNASTGGRFCKKRIAELQQVIRKR